MVERESKVKLVFEVDKRGITGVNRETGKVRGAFDKLTGSVSSATKATREKFASLRKDIRKTKQEAKGLGDELVFQWERGTSKLLDSPLKGGRKGGDGGFGSGESGNIGGRFGQLRGAASQVGLGGGRELGVAQSIFEVGQALPELKEGFGGLTKQMGVSTKALAGLGIAFAALGIAIAVLGKDAETAKQEVSSATEASRQYYELIQNETAESLDALIAKNQQAQQDEKELQSASVNAQNEARENVRETWGAIGNPILNFGSSLESLGASLSDDTAAIQQRSEDLQESTNRVIDLEAEEQVLIEARESEEIAMRGVSEAILATASAEGERVRLIQKAGEMGVEATNARIDAIENETAQIEAQLEVLRNSGVASEEITAQVEELQQSMANLGTEAGILTSSLESGVAAGVDSQKDLGKSIEEAAKTAEQSALKIEAANTKYADSIKNIGTQASQALSDAKIKAKESSKDLATTLSDDLFEGLIEQAEEQSDILREGRRDDARELRDSNRELKNIRRDGLKSEKDAARDRNFLALAETREDTREQLSESADAAKEQRDERQIALDDEFADLRLQSTRQRGERLRDFGRSNRDLKINLDREFRNIKTSKQRQLKLAADALSKELKLAADGANKKLTIEQEFWKQSIELIQKALKSVGGAGARTSGRAPTDALAALGLFD